MALAGDTPASANDADEEVKPLAFKTLVGRGHPEFSSNRQQDAHEYLGHLMDIITRSEHGAGSRLPTKASSSKLFEFGVETRIECLKSHRVSMQAPLCSWWMPTSSPFLKGSSSYLVCLKVSYKTEKNTVLSLEIAVDAAINSEEVANYQEREQKRQKLKSQESEEKVLPEVPLEACLQKYAADELVDGYYSAYLKEKTQAKRTVRLSSFPTYLVIHLRRYYVGEDWTPKKLEVLVDMPEKVSLNKLRASGHQVCLLPTLSSSFPMLN